MSNAMTRAEHLEWCKQRAREFIAAGDYNGAYTSMASDLSKHPETRGHAGIELGLMEAMFGQGWTHQSITKHIEGYN
jgi:hypothetical protein